MHKRRLILSISTKWRTRQLRLESMSAAAAVPATTAAMPTAKAAAAVPDTAACGADRFILFCKFLLRIGKSKLGGNRIQYFPGGCFGGACRAHCYKIVDQCGKNQREQGVADILHGLRNSTPC